MVQAEQKTVFTKKYLEYALETQLVHSLGTNAPNSEFFKNIFIKCFFAEYPFLTSKEISIASFWLEDLYIRFFLLANVTWNFYISGEIYTARLFDDLT